MFLYSYVIVKENEILEFNQLTGVSLEQIIEKAKNLLEENDFIIKDSKRWIDPTKKCMQFIIEYVDKIGIARKFVIVHIDMADALTIFNELVWHEVDYRIGINIKVGAEHE